MSEATIDNTIQSLDEIIIEKFNKYAPVGLAVGVVRDGQLVYARGFGMANIKKKLEVTPDTVFRIGSISKTFTTIGLMQLWEQGKFDLDDPVNPYLKTYKVLHSDPHAPSITFRHMLTHTSGIGETRTTWDLLKSLTGNLEIAADPDESITPLSEFYHGLLRAETYPGFKWAYANHAYATLGQLIADISGQPFEEYMRDHVFKPLGMEKSDYLLTDRVRDDLAQGYNFKKGSFVPIPYKRVMIGAAGSIFSSVNEMAKYAAALMNGGENQYGRVIQSETLDMMMTPQLDNDIRVFNMGLTFWLEKYGDHLVIEHGGGWPGFISSFRVAPKEKVAVMAFVNSSSMASDVIGKEIMYRLLGVPNPAEEFPPKGILKKPYLWEELTGFYGPLPGFRTNARIWMQFGGELEVFVNKQNQLAVRGLIGPAAKGIPVYRTDPEDDLLFTGSMKEGPLQGITIPMLFVRNEAGEIDRILIQQNTLYKRPYQQSVKYRKNILLGILGGLALFFLGKKKLKKCC
jgi:CubicO group peptidase (beta-lactamase class C family)